MEVVPNGIDIDETIRLASAKVPELPLGDGLRLIYPATLSEIKDQATAIKGLAEYVNNGGNASLWLCGDVAPGNSDAYLRKLQKLADELNVSNRVHFLGWRDNVPSVMAECDIVVLTSVTEAFGRVLLEAMCLRKPIIASRVGGILEVVRDGIDSILFDAKDSSGLAQAIEKLAGTELRKKMGQAGFERVTACYDIKKVAFRFFELISKIS
jgi:glycosyltransferase involved in cell wall biosynthesis